MRLGTRMSGPSFLHCRVSVELVKSKLELNGGILLGHCLEVGMSFEQHKIVQLQKLLLRFPHKMAASGDELGGREKFKSHLLRKENHLM